MKNIFKFIIILITVVFIACEKEYVEPSQFSDVGWYTSLFRNDPSNWNVGVNNFISFTDASVNELEHEWEIPEGAYFLEGPISRSDTVFMDKIKYEGQLTTTDKTIHVLFTEGGGKHTVKLRNVFEDSVAFRGLDTIPATQQPNGTWLYEAEFEIDVYDTIQAQALIRQDGVVIDHEDTIFVENGNSIDLIDITTVGRPNTRSFRIGNASGSDSVSTLILKNLGVFEATFQASRTGENIPGDFDRYVFPNPIKVTPSSLPFELAGEIMEIEDQTLRVPFSGEFNPVTVNANQIPYFTVMVNGGAFDVASLGLKSDDASILEIKLVEQIYKSDAITVTLADGSTLEAADTRAPVPFADEVVAMYQHDIADIDIYGFETGHDAVVPTWDNIGTITVTDEKAATGTYSLKLDAPAGNWTAFNMDGIAEALFDFTGGVAYELKYKLWIDPATTQTFHAPWFLPSWKQFWTSHPSERGEWVDMTRGPWTPGSDTPDSFIYFRVNQAGILYIDDMRVQLADARP